MITKILIILSIFFYSFICHGFSNEYEAKAAWVNFVFNNTKTSQNNKNLICTIGLDSVGLLLKENNYNIEERLTGEDFNNCRILYISKSEERSVATILKEVNKFNLITISDIERFISYGGSIKLNIKNNIINLNLNKNNIFYLESKGWIIDSNIKNMSTGYE
jgi:DNA-dependent RNA polymerase auxiliary subunit epsilon